MRTTSVDKPKTIHSPEAPQRNNGIPLDLGWLKQVQVNKSAAERRTATLIARRTVKKQWQTAWLLKAVSCIDLTTLAGDDTPGKIRRLCAKARHPVRTDLLEAMGVADLGITCRCGVRLPEHGFTRCPGARRIRHPGRLSGRRVPGRTQPDEIAARRDSLRSPRRRGRD